MTAEEILIGGTVALLGWFSTGTARWRSALLRAAKRSMVYLLQNSAQAKARWPLHESSNVDWDLADCAGGYFPGLPRHHVHAPKEDRGPGSDSRNRDGEGADSLASYSGWTRPCRRRSPSRRWIETENVGNGRNLLRLFLSAKSSDARGQGGGLGTEVDMGTIREPGKNLTKRHSPATHRCLYKDDQPSYLGWKFAIRGTTMPHK